MAVSKGLTGLLILMVGCGAPLYEDPTPPAKQRFEPCCPHRRIDTCACAPQTSCDFSFRACADGVCIEAPRSGPTPSCPSGGADAGTGQDGGAPPGDGGLPSDAGTPADAGLPAPHYVACCALGRISTCRCDAPCSSAPFTSCALGRCVAGVGADCP